MDDPKENAPAEIYYWKGDDRHQKVTETKCSGHFLFIFTRSGIFRADVDGKMVCCTANEFIIALCRNYYQVGTLKKDIHCYLVKVDWQFITDIKMSGRFIELLVSRQVYKIFPDQFGTAVISRIMKLLHYYYQYMGNRNRFPMASFGAALSLLVFQASWHQDMNEGSRVAAYNRKELLTVAFFRKLIRHYREEHSVAFYAGVLCVTKGYLSRSVHEVTGKTVMQSITELLVSDSKSMLLGSDATVEEISEQLHFSSSGSFSRLFKKQTGVTPTTYRKTYGG